MFDGCAGHLERPLQRPRRSANQASHTSVGMYSQSPLPAFSHLFRFGSRKGRSQSKQHPSRIWCCTSQKPEELAPPPIRSAVQMRVVLEKMGFSSRTYSSTRITTRDIASSNHRLVALQSMTGHQHSTRPRLRLVLQGPLSPGLGPSMPLKPCVGDHVFPRSDSSHEEQSRNSRKVWYQGLHGCHQSFPARTSRRHLIT